MWFIIATLFILVLLVPVVLIIKQMLRVRRNRRNLKQFRAAVERDVQQTMTLFGPEAEQRQRQMYEDQAAKLHAEHPEL